MDTAIPLTEIYKTVPKGLQQGDVLMNSDQRFIMIVHENSTDQTYVGYVELTTSRPGQYHGRYSYGLMRGTTYFTKESIKKILHRNSLNEWKYVGNIVDVIASAVMPF